MSVLLGKTLIDNGIVSALIEPEKQVQPIGIDLTVRSIENFNSSGTIDFDNSNRMLPRMSESGKINNIWILSPGAYLVTFNEIINVPSDCMGIARTRSSLLRMGATLETSVWDPGYQGRSQSMLVVYNTAGIKVHQNAKLVQIVFMKTEDTAKSLYSGVYQNENV